MILDLFFTLFNLQLNSKVIKNKKPPKWVKIAMLCLKLVHFYISVYYLLPAWLKFVFGNCPKVT